MSQGDEILAKSDWAGEQGDRWLANVERFEAMLAPIGEALLKRAGYSSGEHVLDIGCGGGASTRAIASLVAPEGTVLGIDISPGLIAHAAGLSIGDASIDYVCIDAAKLTLDKPFDRIHSRFGAMFFDDPHAAFANMHGLLKEGGRMDLAVWAHPRDNLWMMELMGVVRKHVEVPQADPKAPGPFAFEDQEYLNEILAAGGFSAVKRVAYSGQQAIGGPGATPKEATKFVLGSLGVGKILEDQDEEIASAASRGLTQMFERSFVDGKGVMLDCKAWLVTAHA
jgi:SAM-dependent methyltransferase